MGNKQRQLSSLQVQVRTIHDQNFNVPLVSQH